MKKKKPSSSHIGSQDIWYDFHSLIVKKNMKKGNFPDLVALRNRELASLQMNTKMENWTADFMSDFKCND